MSEVRTRADVHEWILKQVRQRPGCQDFSQEFRLLGDGPNWECVPTNCYDWDRPSLEAFDQVVGDARRRFELLGQPQWPSDLGRRLARVDYAGRTHNPRLAVHHETKVTVRRHKGVENVIRSRTENLKAF